MTTAVRRWQNVDAVLFLDVIKPQARPAVLENLVGDWPMVEAAKASDAGAKAYLKGFAAPDPVPFFEGPADIGGRFFYADERLDRLNFSIRQAPFDVFLDRLAGPEALYAGSLPLARHFPGFARANSLGGLIPSSQAMASLWIGNRTLVAPHYDIPENIACVVAGRRRFTLFPTGQFRNLYVGPMDVTPAGQAISLVDIRHPDLERFPRFAEALEVAEVAELGPGDALYIPSLWWHGVESLEPFGALVNVWWRDTPAYTGSPYAALLHAALTLKDLPQAQRQNWREVFDHLIFQSDGPAQPHLSDAQRGLFGAPSPDRAARLRNIIERFS
ncbi:cupin-like domain-containing protein [Asticcacaulis solisilvae]|uniref:cupin-like domain-containing protein n=1 Tax=Asticcacaulis solisilvae TaxID=1217274 RepID=UPI003FD71DC3